MSPMPDRPGADRRRTAIVALVAVVATLLFAVATWALFLAPREGGGSVEEFARETAALLRRGEFDAVRERLDASFSFDPGGLDRDAVLAVAKNEFAAGRFFPYVALVHPIAGGDGDGESHWAVLGILAQGDPERKRDVSVRAVRLELRILDGDDGFRVRSARFHQGR